MPQPKRSLYVIAGEILREWRTAMQTWKKTPNWFIWSRPYIDAMLLLENKDSMYGADSGDTIIRYALSNMEGWRGEAARRLKLELKEHLK